MRSHKQKTNCHVTFSKHSILHKRIIIITLKWVLLIPAEENRLAQCNKITLSLHNSGTRSILNYANKLFKHNFRLCALIKSLYTNVLLFRIACIEMNEINTTVRWDINCFVKMNPSDGPGRSTETHHSEENRVPPAETTPSTFYRCCYCIITTNSAKRQCSFRLAQLFKFWFTCR